MRFGKLLFLLVRARIRLLVYVGFISISTVLCVWMFGGFENRQTTKTALVSIKARKVEVLSPILKRYCNYPLYNATGNALNDASSTNLALRGLVVITRHGDRAPLLSFPRHLSIPNCGLSNSADIDLFHQYRTDLTNAGINGLPIHETASTTFRSFQSFPPNERCRPGHLSAIGIVQMIRLGRLLREHYQKTWSFPSKFTECQSWSTSYPRTYQSALAFLYGWTGGVDGTLKDAGGQKGHECKLQSMEAVTFCSGDWCMCPNRIGTYRTEFHRRRDEFTKKETKDKEITSIVRKIGAILDTPKLEDVVSAFDTLMGYACHEESLPCNPAVSMKPISGSTKAEKSDTCVTTNWVIRLLNEAKNANAVASKSTSGKNFASVESVPIFAYLSSLVDELTSTKKSMFRYYSGHDVTLCPLLSVLDVWDGSIPPYASHLAFEFVEHINEDKESILYFRILYNGDDVTDRVTSSICSDSVLSRYNDAVFKLCNVKGLINYSKNFISILKNGDKKYGDSWVNLCR